MGGDVELEPEVGADGVDEGAELAEALVAEDAAKGTEVVADDAGGEVAPASALPGAEDFRLVDLGDGFVDGDVLVGEGKRVEVFREAGEALALAGGLAGKKCVHGADEGEVVLAGEGAGGAGGAAEAVGFFMEDVEHAAAAKDAVTARNLLSAGGP
jgi:hypothetical protein